MTRSLFAGLLTLGMVAAVEIASADDEVPGGHGEPATTDEARQERAPAATEEDAPGVPRSRAARDETEASELPAATHTFSLIENSRVSIRKVCPEKRYLGTSVKFEITILNESDSTARDVVVTDEVCDTTTFLSASEGGEFKDGKVVWKLGDLPARQSRTLTTTVEATEIGELECPARVEWRAIASVDDKCKSVVSGIPAILLECIDLEDPIEVGGVVTYEIAVTNQGSADGRNLVVVATLPDQLQYVSSSGPTEASVKGQVVTFAALETLAPMGTAPKNKVLWMLKAKAVGVGDIRFRIDLTTDQSPEPIIETESTNLYQ